MPKRVIRGVTRQVSVVPTKAVPTPDGTLKACATCRCWTLDANSAKNALWRWCVNRDQYRWDTKTFADTVCQHWLPYRFKE